MRRCLIIFAKEPERGKVKTRLKPYLSEIRSLNLYKAFLKDAVSIARKIECEEKIIAYESSSKKPVYLMSIAPLFKSFRQEGENLGRRMHNAFLRVCRNKASRRMVIIGSDCPDLPVEYIQNAFSKLGKNDLVLGPSSDGGFYLVALKKPCFELFKGIKWSSRTVLRDTLKNAKALRKKTALLATWSDVDEPSDLDSLICRLKEERDRSIAVWTRSFLKV